MPKGGSAGGASRFCRGPKMGLGEGMGRTRIKADDSVEVSKKIELQQSRSQNLEKSTSPKGWSYKHRGPKMGQKVEVPSQAAERRRRSTGLAKHVRHLAEQGG
ncbi:unnamed protein product [Sphagnum jensenii]|uniref:Uncharacterized protein n=1 Tax=Sphagnum jensenii TaxID=128206 RepID=A0ABP1AXM0_9BRYO